MVAFQPLPQLSYVRELDDGQVIVHCAIKSMMCSHVAQLCTAFEAGTSKRTLAERYDIGEKSVKMRLREHGIQRAGS